MKLLVDTDAFCKLSASGLFFKAIDLLGADITECARLPALPYMLKKGRLRTMYGPAVCDELMPIAHSMPIVDCTNNVWLDKLTLVQSIDPGEAQLFAMGAATGFLVMTGDKRALRELKSIPDFPQLLSGRIVVLETVLIPNPPKDTDGRREDRRRGMRELQGRWPGLDWGRWEVGGGTSVTAQAPNGRLRELGCAGDGKRIGSRELPRSWLVRVGGDVGSVAEGAVRLGVEWLAAGPGRD